MTKTSTKSSKKAQLAKKAQPQTKLYPSRDEMRAVFVMCRQNQWSSVLNSIRSNEMLAITPMVMDNNITTTVMHQAITSKGDTVARAKVMEEILKVTPEAAKMKNGYGSFPLHVISQRNTKINASTKARLIKALVRAYKGALLEEGGVGMRTPLHIIFTDYISLRLTDMMIDNGRESCFKKDRKGYLPAHVACSRHCSPQKLKLLLDVNPAALTALTNDGDTLLSLARSTATKSHPNYNLIDTIIEKLKEVGAPVPDFVSKEKKLKKKNPGKKSQRPRPSKKPSATKDKGNSKSSFDRIKKSKGSEDSSKLEAAASQAKVEIDDDANLLLHFSAAVSLKEGAHEQEDLDHINYASV